MVGGACVSQELCRKIKNIFPTLSANIVYGSSEAEPIAFASIDEFLESKSFGLLLGKQVPCIEVKILPLEVSQMNECVYEFGEILITGPHVVKEYIDNHPMNKVLKVKDGERVWHRTGDIGYLDEEKRLWLLGRLNDRIIRNNKLIPCYGFEEDISRLNGVSKAAFVGDKLYLQIDQGFEESNVLDYLNLHEFSGFQIIVHDQLPVDRRHFSRVDRHALRHNESKSH